MVAGQNPPVQVIQVAGGEPAAVQLHHRAQFGREHGQDGHDHVLHPVFAAPEGFQQAHPFAGFGTDLRGGGSHFQLGVVPLLVEVRVQELQEFQDRLRAHFSVESLTPEGFQPVVTTGGKSGEVQARRAAAGDVKLVRQFGLVAHCRRQFQIVPQPCHVRGARPLGRVPTEPSHGLNQVDGFLAPFGHGTQEVIVDHPEQVAEYRQLPAPQRDLLPLVVRSDVGLNEFNPVFQFADHFHVGAVRLQTVQQRVERGQIPASSLRIVVGAAVVPTANRLFDGRQSMFDLCQIVRQWLLGGGSKGRGTDAGHRRGHSADGRRQRLVVYDRDVVAQAFHGVKQVILQLFAGIPTPRVEGVNYRLRARRLLVQSLGDGPAAVVQAGDRHCNLVAFDRRHGQLVGGVDHPFGQEQPSNFVGGALGLDAFRSQVQEEFQVGREIAFRGVRGVGKSMQGRFCSRNRLGQRFRWGGNDRHGFVQAAFQRPIAHAVRDALPGAIGNRQRPFPKFIDFRAVPLQLFAHQVDVDLVDDVGRVVEDPGEVGQFQVKGQAHHAGRVFHEPDVGHRSGEGDMPEPLATDVCPRDLNATAVAHHALVLLALVFAALAFPVLGGAEDTLAEQPVLFGPLRAVVDRFALLDLAGRPPGDLLGRGYGNAYGVEIG